MPLLKLDITERLSDEAKRALCTKLSKICAEATSKPEAYVMVVVNDGAAMSHGGAFGKAAFVDVRGIGGLTGKVNRMLSETICVALADVAQIPGNRVYLNFTSVEGVNWGHDGSTFG